MSSSTIGSNAAHAGHWKSENSTKYVFACGFPIVWLLFEIRVSLGTNTCFSGLENTHAAPPSITTLKIRIPRKNLDSSVSFIRIPPIDSF